MPPIFFPRSAAMAAFHAAKTVLATVVFAFSSGAAMAASGGAGAPESSPPLHLAVFNPGEEGIFPVASVLVTGERDAILIDAQFSAADAQRVVQLVEQSKKNLRTIYISHGDPDYYFGLATLHKAFPEARIVATAPTIAHIKATQAEKLKVWGPKLGENAPEAIVIPEPLEGAQLLLEGQALQIKGLDGPSPDRTYVWIPSLKAVVGGIAVVAGEHVWMADTPTAQSHTDWLASLESIKALQPEVVIPGHFAAGAPLGLAAVQFTQDYIRAFDEEAAKARNGQALIDAMTERYRALGGQASLEISAKVAKGEIQWR